MSAEGVHVPELGEPGTHADVLVTVGIPTYNRCGSLRRAIESVLEQDHTPRRVVVSDNASEDGTPALVEDLIRRHPELEYRRHSENCGPTANFQSLWPTTGDGFFMWLGDDDWLGPGSLAACAEQLLADPSLVMVAPATRYHSDDGTSLEEPVNLIEDDPCQRVLSYFKQVSTNGVFFGLTRCSALAAIPGFSNLMGGDWLHVAALAFQGRIRTLDHVEIHRSVGGATRSLADVARHLGLGWLPRTVPQAAIAWHVFVDIGWRSPAYVSLSRPRRVSLGARAATIIVVRFIPRAVVKYLRIRLDRLRRRGGPRPAAHRDPEVPA